MDKLPKNISEIKESTLYLIGHNTTIQGLVSSIRKHKNFTFTDVTDPSGSIQIISNLPLSNVVVGDNLYAYGRLIKTKMNDIALDVEQFSIINRSKESNNSVLFSSKNLYQKSIYDSLSSCEDILKKHGFTRVYTPCLQINEIVSPSKSISCNLAFIRKEMYLRKTIEFSLRRMTARGYKKIYEIGSLFRDGNFSPRHSPEFLLLEGLVAYSDVSVCEDLVLKIINKVLDLFNNKTQNEIKTCCYLDMFKNDKDKSKLITTEEQYLKILDEQPEKINEYFKYMDKAYTQNRSNLKGVWVIRDHPIWLNPFGKVKDESTWLQKSFAVIVDGLQVAHGNQDEIEYTKVRENLLFQARTKNIQQGNLDSYYRYIETIYSLPISPEVTFSINVPRLVQTRISSVNYKEWFSEY